MKINISISTNMKTGSSRITGVTAYRELFYPWCLVCFPVRIVAAAMANYLLRRSMNSNRNYISLDIQLELSVRLGEVPSKWRDINAHLVFPLLKNTIARHCLLTDTTPVQCQRRNKKPLLLFCCSALFCSAVLILGLVLGLLSATGFYLSVVKSLDILQTMLFLLAFFISLNLS
ncbi:hypothetical protein KQX54_012330 [Cotesia glomerata]|uniref:Uncharacterized protein n=1 Tax=Cotesia glomerata TaxID=32391 RepID=A0AAV7IUR6_COTGL|nr:hypothetical protein KQX54_012330 [Cotesia glomerata]